MTPEEQSDLLIRIDQKLTDLITTATTDGFPRCIEREGRLKAVETAVSKQQDNQKWLWRTVSGAGIIMALRTAWGYLSGAPTP